MLLSRLDPAGMAPGDCIRRTMGVALACVFVASASAQSGVGAGAERRSAAPPDSVLAAEAVWLRAKLPELASVQMTRQVGIMATRVRVTRATLDRCMLTLERVTETMDASRSRRRDLVPLDRVDAQSIRVQQQSLDPEPGVSSTRPWRIVLALLDGSIQADIDGVSSGRRTSQNSTTLELLVTSETAGLDVASHLHAAVQACQ
jgi:hypothetical protein